MNLTQFENLPNEILLTIFRHIELSNLFQSFSFLNSRISNLITDGESHFNAELQPNHLEFSEFFCNIRYLTLNEWEPNAVFRILDQSKFSKLKSIKIRSRKHLYFGFAYHLLIRQILNLNTLESCQFDVPSTTFLDEVSLPVSRSIRRLKLNMITLDQLILLLQQLPNLHTLDIWLNCNGRRVQLPNISFHEIRRLSLLLHSDILFVDIVKLLKTMPELYFLKIDGSVWDHSFYDASQWNHILLTSERTPKFSRIMISLSIRCFIGMIDLQEIRRNFELNLFNTFHFEISDSMDYWLFLRFY